MKRLSHSILLILLFACIAHASDPGQPSDSTDVRKEKSLLPSVFLIGDNPDLFERLSGIYNKTLIDACEDDMDLAFRNWMEQLMALEDYATENEFEINGTKLWIKIFWGESGTVDHLAFHLKPNSRNIDIKSLTNFLEGFVTGYRLPVTHTSKFSHYSSASFPTFYKRALSE